MKYEVIKTVTYDLTQIIEAPSKDEAIEMAEDIGDWEQIDGNDENYCVHEMEEGQ
jgi:hypothetical protein